MKIEARIFELLTAFFFIGGVVYTICTHFSSRGVEWAGVTAMSFSGGLTLLAGTYFRFVARRVEIRPEDYEDAEIEDGAGELGFFSPHSWWPLFLAAAAAVCFLGLAVGWWVFIIGAFFAVPALIGWTFEYWKGEHAL